MWKYVGLFCFMAAMPVQAQMASLNKAKYVTVVKVVSEHQLDNKDLVSDIDKLRGNSKFRQELKKMLEKLDNEHPNTAKNRRVERILEQAGKDIYNELK